MSGFIEAQPVFVRDTMSVAGGTDPNARLTALLEGPTVTVLGTRADTDYGKHVTHDLVAALVEAGVTIVTPLTVGISLIAVRTALACGGNVVLVLPRGLATASPAATIDQFAARVADGSGAVVSFLPDDALTSRTGFREAHYDAAHMGGAVLIPEANQLSFVTQVAIQAHAHAKPVFAVPGPVTSTQSTGCHELIRRGHATLAVDHTDLVAVPRRGARPVLAGATT